MRVEVVLAPVSVQMEPSLRVVGFRTDEEWARRLVTDNPTRAARELVDDLPPEYRHIINKQGIEPVGVAFHEQQPTHGDRQLTLLYSIALPAPLADPDVPLGDRWIPLLDAGGSQTQASRRGSNLLHKEVPYAEDLVGYWREQLEEEPRLFAFLPRYFTARQARDVYSAFWGYDQDPDGFATWSGIGRDKQGVYSSHIEEQGVLSEGALLAELVDTVLQADNANTLGGPFGAALLCETASNGAVGLWPRSSAVGSVTQDALLPLLAAASLIAYQRPSRGPKPNWYQRTADTPIVEHLQDLYAPRAVWVFPPKPQPDGAVTPTVADTLVD